MARRHNTRPTQHNAYVDESSEFMELRQYLYEQLHFLRKSCAEYDNGDELEIKRISGPVRVLMHTKSGEGNQSLLDQLGLLKTLKFVNSGIDSEGFKKNFPVTSPWENWIPNYMFYPIETYRNISGRYMWRSLFNPFRFGNDPKLPGNSAPLPFDDWWNGTFIVDRFYKPISRSFLITKMVNRDGYAHVDPRLPPEYKSLKTEDLGIDIVERQMPSSKIGRIRTIGGSILNALIRQVGYELLLTIETFLQTRQGTRFNHNGRRLDKITPPPSFELIDGRSFWATVPPLIQIEPVHEPTSE